MSGGVGDEAGFTLFELLAYLGVAALISIGLANASWVFNRATDSTLGHLQKTSALDVAMRRLADALQRARPASSRDAQFSFSGSISSLTFIQADGGSVPQFVRLSSLGRSGGGRLLWETSPYVEGAPPNPTSWASAGPNIETPFQLRFQYRAPWRGQTDWTADWADHASLPQQVRIVGGDVGDPASPALTVTLAVDAEVGCAGFRRDGCSLNTKDGHQ